MNLQFVKTEPYIKQSYQSMLRLPETLAGGEGLSRFLSKMEKESFYYDGTHLICLWLDGGTKAAMEEGLPCVDPDPFHSYLLCIQLADKDKEAGYTLRMTFFPASRFVRSASGDEYLFPDLIASNYYSLLLDDSLSSFCEEYFLPETLFTCAEMYSLLSVCHVLTDACKEQGTHRKKVSG